MSVITTHVLDTSIGKPASGIPVVLEHKTDTTGWQVIGEAATDADGRVRDFGLAAAVLEGGQYRLVFETSGYFQSRDVEYFFPHVTLSFIVKGDQHYHVPLLLNPYGYSTYRGS